MCVRALPSTLQETDDAGQPMELPGPAYKPPGDLPPDASCGCDCWTCMHVLFFTVSGVLIASEVRPPMTPRRVSHCGGWRAVAGALATFRYTAALVVALAHAACCLRQGCRLSLRFAVVY